MTPIILCGGSGSRLWPLSRTSHPKQFLKIFGGHSLFQETFLRLPEAVCSVANTYVITNHHHRFLATEQLDDIDKKNIQLILESESKSTAPAIAIAALKVAERDPDEVMVVLSADHIIHDLVAFERVLQQANQAALTNAIVTLGIKPTTPETGYGYLEIQESLSGKNAVPVHQFVEKPDLVTANQYLKSERFYWNSGIFIFKAKVILDELKKSAPDILEQCQNSLNLSSQDKNFLWLEANSFNACRSESIDYAVMEKSKSVVMIPFDGGWNDVGSWSAIWDESPKTKNSNVFSGDVLTVDVNNSYIHANSRLVGAVDVNDLVIVETADAVLVTKRQSSQRVKELVDQLKTHSRSEQILHQHVHRPWGGYEILSSADHYQVKRLTLKPGARISVQYHHHRSEHWVIISGIAKVRVGEQYMTLSQNQSTFIPVGVIHSLENPGDENLEVIEVQSGSYLGEDDIVRLEDYYGRSNN
jgi:mannose-1-phosphate guanylyltransferase/mannose-6-phosphate isomerase